MELPWNLCPHCATPTPGMRREQITLDDALQSLVPSALEDEDVEEIQDFTILSEDSSEDELFPLDGENIIPEELESEEE